MDPGEGLPTKDRSQKLIDVCLGSYLGQHLDLRTLVWRKESDTELYNATRWRYQRCLTLTVLIYCFMFHMGVGIVAHATVFEATGRYYISTDLHAAAYISFVDTALMILVVPTICLPATSKYSQWIQRYHMVINSVFIGNLMIW